MPYQNLLVRHKRLRKKNLKLENLRQNGPLILSNQMIKQEEERVSSSL